jgi:hypothetical protein
MSNVISIDPRPTDTRMGPYLVDTGAATETLDNAIGALALACDAVSGETGTKRNLWR